MIAERAMGAKTDEARVQDVLDHLDRDSISAESSGTFKRRDRRWSFRRGQVIVTVEHPGGGLARLVAWTRNISYGGIGLVAPAFIYPRSACTVKLTRQDGEVQEIHGQIAFCRHVEGTLHEIGLKFNQRIDPLLFLDAHKRKANEGNETVDLTTMRGRILYLDDSDFDQRLLAHHLRGSGVELHAARNSTEALEMVAQRMFDILLCDLNLGGGQDSTGFVKAVRKQGFGGPIVMVTAESSGAKLAAARAAGAEHVLNKPYQRKLLLELMSRLHQSVGAITSEDVLYSTTDDQPGMNELLGEYVREARVLADRLQDAIQADDLATARELCLNLKGSAVGYGFAPLGMAAEAAIKSLDATMSASESRPALRHLILTCGNLGLRQPTPPAGAAPATVTGGGGASAPAANKADGNRLV